MVSVPAAPCYPFGVKGIEIEGDDAHGVDVQFPWEEHPQRTRRRGLTCCVASPRIYFLAAGKYAMSMSRRMWQTFSYHPT